jgi:hypothetical protein
MERLSAKKIRPSKFCAGGWSGVDRVIDSDLALLTVL